MQKWIVTKGQITHKEGWGKKIECWLFLGIEPEAGDILSLEGKLYHILNVAIRANKGAYTLTMEPHK
jgi:hypothetical protein